MNFESLLLAARNEPIFTTGLLLTYGASRADVERQLSRWARSGKVIQLRRGLYTLADPYRNEPAHPFYVANRLRTPSYISLQSALAWHGMIPEAVHAVTSVTTDRPERIATPQGAYIFRHIRKSLFSGYETVDLGEGRTALVAKPEKALLDLVYLTPHADDERWLAELRLQNLDRLDLGETAKMAQSSGSAKLKRALRFIQNLSRADEYETL